MDLKEILKNFDFATEKIEALKVKAEKGFDKYGIYPGSINRVGNAFVMIMRTDTEKKLVCLGDDDRLAGLDGMIVPFESGSAKVCSVTNENCRIIRKNFPFMNPAVHKGKKVTIGLGDRLGLASQGHIRTVSDLDVFPVLAQQSIRELNLTG
ncbi:MAG TPA: tagaturonate epimerase family protein, partial [Clostridia bacterium]